MANDHQHRRDFHLIFPFLKWEFGGRLFDLFRMTSQGQTFLKKLGALVCMPCQKMFDRGWSP